MRVRLLVTLTADGGLAVRVLEGDRARWQEQHGRYLTVALTPMKVPVMGVDGVVREVDVTELPEF